MVAERHVSQFSPNQCDGKIDDYEYRLHLGHRNQDAYSDSLSTAIIDVNLKKKPTHILGEKNDEF